MSRKQKVIIQRPQKTSEEEIDACDKCNMKAILWRYGEVDKNHYELLGICQFCGAYYSAGTS
jgi:transcription elongation factor Elf1